MGALVSSHLEQELFSKSASNYSSRSTPSPEQSPRVGPGRAQVLRSWAEGTVSVQLLCTKSLPFMALHAQLAIVMEPNQPMPEVDRVAYGPRFSPREMSIKRTKIMAD